MDIRTRIQYLRQRLTFIWLAASNWQSLYLLIYHTIRFSLAIRYLPLKQRLLTEASFSRIKIRWRGQLLDICLRTQDVPILFEVFVKQPYQLPPAWEKEIRTIIDLGANVGFTSLFFACGMPSVQRILAVEPSPKNVNLLEQNLLGRKNIQLVPKAVSAVEQLLFLQTNGLAINHALTEQEGIPIETTSVANLMRDYHFDHIDLLKIDIEGHEETLFEAPIKDWLNQTTFLILELHDNYSEQQLVLALNPYQLILIRPNPILNTKLYTACREQWIKENWQAIEPFVVG